MTIKSAGKPRRDYDLGEITAQDPVSKPRNEIDYLQEQSHKLQAEIEEQKAELLRLYRRLDSMR